MTQVSVAQKGAKSNPVRASNRIPDILALQVTQQLWAKIALGSGNPAVRSIVGQ
jgi:hypothetical protein